VHPCGLTALVKAVYKSIPGNLLSNTWIVHDHECVCHVQKKEWISVLVRRWTVFLNTVTYNMHIEICLPNTEVSPYSIKGDTSVLGKHKCIHMYIDATFVFSILRTCMYAINYS